LSSLVTAHRAISIKTPTTVVIAIIFLVVVMAPRSTDLSPFLFPPPQEPVLALDKARAEALSKLKERLSSENIHNWIAW
jgi:hypothetical protein